jgi:hypothetical protein
MELNIHASFAHGTVAPCAQPSALAMLKANHSYGKLSSTDFKVKFENYNRG